MELDLATHLVRSRFGKVWFKELKYQGVKVSYIEPGGLQTDFFKKAEDVASHGANAGSVYSPEPGTPRSTRSASSRAGRRTNQQSADHTLSVVTGDLSD
jgi:short-subunit dehydrogenase